MYDRLFIAICSDLKRSMARGLENSRAEACTRENLVPYFDRVGGLIRDRGISLSRLWNVDEKLLRPTLKPQKVCFLGLKYTILHCSWHLNEKAFGLPVILFFPRCSMSNGRKASLPDDGSRRHVSPARGNR